MNTTPLHPQIPSLLADGISLQLFSGGNELIFESSGKWLYPLFEVEDFLHEQHLDASGLYLHDRIGGSAAASLIARMGFVRCFIDTVSTHAEAVFRREGVEFGFDKLVDKIECRTEDLITEDMDLESVHRMLSRRAGRYTGVGLEMKALRAGYGGAEILRGLDLSMEAGEQLVITGDNGTGKTTLLKTLIGTVMPSSGSIVLDGKPVEKAKTIPSVIGYVNQGARTADFAVTAREVVALGLIGQSLKSSDREYRIEIAMRRTGCFHLSGRNINSLSGGERQRVSLARCMAQKAGLILMDEPTSFLDSDSKKDLLHVLKTITRRAMPTVLIVSHDYQWIEQLGWPVRELRDGTLC